MNFPLYKDRLKRLYWFILALIIRPFIKIKQGKVFSWSYYFKQYSCNPKYITEYILDNCPNKFKITWAFNSDVDLTGINHKIKTVRTNSIKYLYELYSSQFIITNSRTNQYLDFFKKKKGQIYIQTWHGSIALKKIEKDAEDSLGAKYIKNAKRDSRMCDLILSNSDFFSQIIRSAFWWKNGEIFQKGIPRNDIFYNEPINRLLRETLLNKYSLSSSTKIILYAPTFRDNNTDSCYRLNFSHLINSFEHRFGLPVVLFLRLHPNSLGLVDVTSLINDSRVIDMSKYHDMQELLCISDVLITDYSSSMFDFAIMNKECFLYAPDYESYNRGFYFDIKELPFTFAATEEQLLSNIESFIQDDYRSSLKRFVDSLKMYEDGHASKYVVDWMTNKMLN